LTINMGCANTTKKSNNNGASNPKPVDFETYRQSMINEKKGDIT